MSKKQKGDRNGFVYSTDPSFRFEPEEENNFETIAPAQQKLRVSLETRQRGGKAVTIIKGFVGQSDDLEALGKSLKNFCGTGGSVKEGEILVQGDQKEKVLQWLLKNGYKGAKKV